MRLSFNQNLQPCQ